MSKLLRHWQRVPELVRAWRCSPAWKEVTRRYLGFGNDPYPFRIPLSGGGVVQVNSREELKVFWQIFIHHCYKLPKDCDTVVDAGANVGIFAIWAARQLASSRIVSLEPFPETFGVFVQNVRDNGLQSRIRTVQCALAGNTGVRLLRKAGESPNRSLVLRGSETDGEGVVATQSKTLKDFLQSEGLNRVDLLKMDIEGSEWEVLFATPMDVLSCIRYIVLEYHEVHARFGYVPENLFEHLAKAGHKLTYREENADRTGLAFFQRQ